MHIVQDICYCVSEYDTVRQKLVNANVFIDTTAVVDYCKQTSGNGFLGHHYEGFTLITYNQITCYPKTTNDEEKICETYKEDYSWGKEVVSFLPIGYSNDQNVAILRYILGGPCLRKEELSYYVILEKQSNVWVIKSHVSYLINRFSCNTCVE